jgi:D-serine dehydratase
MIELTREQGQAVGQPSEIPPRALDPSTQTTYVLIREEIYNRMQALFATEEGNQFVNEMCPQAMEAFGKAGWDDPAMDVYDELDPRRQA